jgi:cysteine-dependent adenosine diphosphate thiazole synthase
VKFHSIIGSQRSQSVTLGKILSLSTSTKKSTINNEDFTAVHKETHAIHKPKEHFVGGCSESEVTNELIQNFHNDIRHSLKCDAIIIGSGLSGLAAAYNLLELANEKEILPRLKITLIEKSFSPGGGAWSGSAYLSGLIVRKPAHTLLDTLDVNYVDRNDKYVVCKNGVQLTAKLLSEISRHPNLTILNGLEVTEILTHNTNDSFSPVRGVACRFTETTGNSSPNAISTFGCNNQSPFFFNCDTVIAACGQQQYSGSNLRNNLRRYASYSNFGFVEPSNIQFGVTDINQAEDYMVHNTREISKGLIVAGSEVAYLDGSAMPGPTAGGRLHSGLHAAELALGHIELARDSKSSLRTGLETAGHFLHDDTLMDCEEQRDH